MKLSIIMPGIRSQNWLELYNSIPNATSLSKEEYEFIIVSPYDLPPELEKETNVRLIKDWGNPTRCTQIGLLHSKGEYILEGIADDGVFCENLFVDKAFEIFNPNEVNKVVFFPYLELLRVMPPKKRARHTKKQMSESWWRFKTHPLGCAKCFRNYFLIMTALMKRDYLVALGGWDCRFEQPGMSHVDLATRLQNGGAEVVRGEMGLTFFHDDVGQPIHKPIEEAFKENDLALFSSLYSVPNTRSKIDFDNWKQAEEVWSRRFPEGPK